jgi:hypothetical protein
LPIGSRSVEDETKYYDGRRAVSIAGLPVAENVSDLTSWPQVSIPLQVVRSEEVYEVRRLLTNQVSQEKTEWMWATNLPTAQASAASV